MPDKPQHPFKSNLDPLRFEKPTPENFRDAALKRFQELAKAKFDRGQKEHGGNIIDRWLVDEAEKEIIDLWYYLQALKVKLEHMHPCDDI